jgi:hypothetical protein
VDNLTEKQLAELSAWAAEKAGVELYSSKHINECGDYFYFDGQEHDYEWDIRDARCRELVREKLKINTHYDIFAKSWYCSTPLYRRDDDCSSPKPAEINCLWAVFEGERGL